MTTLSIFQIIKNIFNTESPCIIRTEYETKYDIFTSLLHRFIHDTNLRTSYGRRWRRG